MSLTVCTSEHPCVYLSKWVLFVLCVHTHVCQRCRAVYCVSDVALTLVFMVPLVSVITGEKARGSWLSILDRNAQSTPSWSTGGIARPQRHGLNCFNYDEVSEAGLFSHLHVSRTVLEKHKRALISAA